VETHPVKEQNQAEDDEDFEQDWNNAPLVAVSQLSVISYQ
jgi:hypothetical protein